eukprot:3335279-Amphidinium_carterae.1
MAKLRSLVDKACVALWKPTKFRPRPPQPKRGTVCNSNPTGACVKAGAVLWSSSCRPSKVSVDARPVS